MRLLFIVILVLLESTAAFRFICYYTNWAQYRPGDGKFLPEDVDPQLCTHIIYAFAKPVGLNIQPFEHNDDDTDWSKGMYSRVLKLKEQNPNLKVLLAIGGWNMASEPFIPLVQTTHSRETFARNTVVFLRQRNFDGLDMDWEYPAARGSSPDDAPKFQLLMATLRKTFEAEAFISGKGRLLLTAAVPAGKQNIDNGYQVADLSRVVDFLNIMTYDFHGGWDTVVGFNSPLYPHTDEIDNRRYLNVDWASRYYVTLGAAKEKLNIGIATYGRSFTLADPEHHSIFANVTGPGQACKYSREAGIMSYYEVCEFLKDDRARIVDVPSQGNRYAVNGNKWVGYDDEKSVVQKTCYARQNGFGGVFFWNLDFDDFNGKFCNKGKNPLFKAAKAAATGDLLQFCPRISNKEHHFRTVNKPVPQWHDNFLNHLTSAFLDDPPGTDHYGNQLPGDIV